MLPAYRTGGLLLLKVGALLLQDAGIHLQSSCNTTQAQQKQIVQPPVGCKRAGKLDSSSRIALVTQDNMQRWELKRFMCRRECADGR